MKRLLAILVLLCMCTTLLVGCDDAKASSSMFITVERSGFYSIVYHRDTKVMYVWNSHVFHALVNADGSPMLWEE